jgi:hypothetical protein
MNKKIYAAKANTSPSPQHRPFRRFIRKMFTSLLKRQADDFEGRFQKEVMQKLQGIEDMIAREMARPVKRGK